jgi:hypothetical protein
VQGLLLIVLPEEDVAHSGQYSSIVGQFGKQDLIPFQGLLGPADYLVYIRNLEDSLRNGDDSLYLFKSLSIGYDLLAEPR